MPVEYASAIGSNACDLFQCGDNEAERAFDFLWQVNPTVFLWLTNQLAQAKERAETQADISKPCRVCGGDHIALVHGDLRRNP